LQSSPVDPGKGSVSGRTPLMGTEVALRLMPAWGPEGGKGLWLRPSLEAGLKWIGFLDDDVEEMSYMSFSLRPGILVGALPPRVLVAYGGQSLLLPQGKDPYGGPPRWFMETHRAEIEVELPAGVTVFGGSGKSFFREQARSRTEADLGAGLQQSVGHVRLLGAISSRLHRAKNPGYNLVGGTALGAVTAPLGRGVSVRGSFVVGGDFYTRSRDYFGSAKDRQDLLVKLGLGVFAPPWHGVTFGLTYEPAFRMSTVDFYDYQDHRVLFRMRFVLEADPTAPRRIVPTDHVSFWEGAAQGGALAERVQDLLRQEDAARRGSSCVQ